MFRPCIDLHEGKVKQIVGGTLEAGAGSLQTNFVSARPAAWYAELYRRDGLRGGHVILLGPGNEAEARSALAAYPGGLQVGGGVTLENAAGWLDAGASHVIVTSWVFHSGQVDTDRLRRLAEAIGKSRLVLDLSCRRRDGRYFVVTDRWQRFTEVTVDAASLKDLAGWCAEFLVHAVDVEGLCRGVDEDLVRLLAGGSPIPATYAGGARDLEDLVRVTEIGRGRVDLTIGSALDIFGGTGIRYQEAVDFNRQALPALGGRGGKAMNIRRWLHGHSLKLLAIRDTPNAVAGGVAIGIFFGFAPLFGLKTIGAIFLAWLTGSNVLAAVIAATLHDVILPFMPVIYRWQYDLGYWLLSNPHQWPPSLTRLRWGGIGLWRFWGTLFTVGKPLLLGGIVSSLPLGVIGFFVSRPLIARHAAKRHAREQEQAEREVNPS